MRSSNKSRSRNKNQNRRTTGNVVNRVFDSSGPEGKVRGTPQQIIEKYQALARDAQLSDDRVAAENFMQHSEHYTRMLGEAMREQNARREQHEAQHGQQQQQQNQQQNQNQNQGQPQNTQQAPVQNHQPAQQPAQQQNQRRENPSEPASNAHNEAQPGLAAPAAVLNTGDSGLVETPESAPKPKKRRTPRRTAPAKVAAVEPAKTNEAAAPSAPNTVEPSAAE